MIPSSDSGGNPSLNDNPRIEQSRSGPSSPTLPPPEWLPNKAKISSNAEQDDVMMDHDDTDGSDDDEDSGWDSLEEDEEDGELMTGRARPQRISNLIEIKGICHIELLGVQFKITHNEDTKLVAILFFH